MEQIGTDSYKIHDVFRCWKRGFFCLGLESGWGFWGFSRHFAFGVFCCWHFWGLVWGFFRGEVDKKRKKTYRERKIQDGRGWKMQIRQVKLWGQFHFCRVLSSVCNPYSMMKAERGDKNVKFMGINFPCLYWTTELVYRNLWTLIAGKFSDPTTVSRVGASTYWMQYFTFIVHPATDLCNFIPASDGSTETLLTIFVVL